MRKNLYPTLSTIILLLLLISFAGPSDSPAADKKERVIKLDSRLELFVDSLIIGQMVNTKFLKIAF